MRRLRKQEKYVKKLLSDETWRRDIVITSQKSIEENGRFKHMFKKIEDIVQFKLLEENNLNNKKSLIILKSDKLLNKSYYFIFFVEKKVKKSLLVKSLIKKLIVIFFKLIPKPILRKIYYFVLSLKNDFK